MRVTITQGEMITLLLEVVATQEILFDAVAMALAKGEPTAYQDIISAKEAALPRKMVEVVARLKGKK